MNRKNNKRKGFTIVELVIVIAVIGILAGIMIPTFGSVVANAQESARDQKAAAAYKDYISNFDYSNGALPIQDGYVTFVEGEGDSAVTYWYDIENGNVDLDQLSTPPTKDTDYVETGKATVSDVTIYADKTN